MIRTVVTRGFGNGTFSGTINLIALRGFIEIVVKPEWTLEAAVTSSFSEESGVSDSWSEESAANDSWSEGGALC